MVVRQKDRLKATHEVTFAGRLLPPRRHGARLRPKRRARLLSGGSILSLVSSCGAKSAFDVTVGTSASKLDRDCRSMTNPVQHSEGTVARLIEEQTAKLSSDVFLWAAVATILLSLTLKIWGQDFHRALFVGQWAPTLLILGLYNKLVKQLGSDRLESTV